ncbi:MAG: ATP-binding protein [Desulfobacteraceae bacterium]|nr:ATP-binding protein [Desulfobacteraceae bacterium]
MKMCVAHKLFLVILTAAGLAVVSSALIMQWSLGRGFLKYVNAVEKTGISRLANLLEERYHNEQSWDSLRQHPGQWRRLIAEALPESAPPGEGGDADEPPRHGHEGDRDKPLPPRMVRHFNQRLFLLDADRRVLISHVEVPADNTATPLLYRGRVVGYLGLLPRTNISDAPQQRFLREQKLAFALVAGVVVLLAAILSLILTRRMTQPLSLLAQATHQLAAGTFSVRVPVTSHDELGQLARDFNSLALALEKSELTRRQWVADISHELRTPLAILRGELEALQDGIRQPGQDMFHSLHNEVLRLGRLVDDLYQVSLSDVGALTYRKTELDLADVLQEAVAVYRPRFMSKGISLELDLPARPAAEVFGDPERLHQLFGNLLDNALKYTDNGGRLLITLRQQEGILAVDFQDSAPGVSQGELESLFERLYRVESSRNRATGGAGLGLTICRNVVEAHGGNITAQSSPLGGVWIRIELPVARS